MKHESNANRFLCVDYQSFVLRTIPIRGVPAVPKSLLSPLVHFVAGPISRHLALKLRKIKEDIAKQTTHRVLRVHPLRDGDELDPIPIENIHQEMEILYGASQTINLVGEDAIDFTVPDIPKHLFERRAV
jgi:hypothetical protein